MKKINNKKSKGFENNSNPCFDKSIINDLINLCENSEYKFYKKNQNLFHENTNPIGIYYLDKGKIKVYKTGIHRNEQIVRFVSSGDFFGMISVITGENRITSATALEDSFVCFIPKEAFMERVKEKPELSYFFMNCLSKVIKEIENRNISIVQMSERERLAEALLTIYKKYGSDTIRILKKDLANFTNIGRKKLTSYLYKFKEKKLIAFNSERIKILDVTGLKDLTKVLV